MEYMEVTGKNIEEAKEEARKALKLAPEEELNYEVIEEGASGILGIGSKEAKIKVAASAGNTIGRIENALQELFKHMGLEVTQKITPIEGIGIKVDIDSEDLAILIGQNGTTLDAIQLLINVIINRGAADRTKIVVDAKGYKERRERALSDLALRQAEKVKHEKRNIILDPMPPNERRIVHLALQDHPHVKTFSSGEEPMRKVIIALKEE